MPFFINTYEYVDDIERLDEIRPIHREFLSTLAALRLSGPTDANGAVLVFEAGSAAEVNTILDDDPFVRNDLVATRRVVGFNPVLGSWMPLQ